MKKLLTFLMKWKWTLLFPLGSLFLWGVSFLSSAGERLWPYVLNQCVSYFSQNQAYFGEAGLGSLSSNIAWFVNGLNAWLPVWDLFSFAFLLLSWRLTYMAIRFFVRALTLGQV